jgi:tRNA G18 (ribose-2'-O)-methylase SpoU
MKVAVLDNLRSVHNVGSIFRTANAVGLDSVILCGTTPTPLDKKGEKRKDFAKVALGAEETLSWSYYENVTDAVRYLKGHGFYIIALEQSESAVDYKNITVEFQSDVAFVIGNEVEGISREVLMLCDVIAEIPMLGSKESLNVTIAFGIGVYRMLGV